MPLPPVRDQSAAVLDHTDASHEDKEERRRRKQEAKRQRDLARQPDAWERYRILADVVVEGRHLIDLADHKARFALVIMGAVNMALLLVVTRTRFLATLPPAWYPWLTGLLVPYTAITFGFLIYAIETLRPRLVWTRRARRKAMAGNRPAPPLGILFWEDVARWDVEQLRRTWDEVQMSRILAEIVELARGVAVITRAKYSALHRLYLCLHAMIIWAALLLTAGAYFAFMAPGSSSPGSWLL